MIRFALGALLVALSVLVWSRAAFHSGLFDRYSRRLELFDPAHAPRNLFLYGFGYHLAGIGCAGPILAGLVAFAVTVGGFWPAFAAFVVYAAVLFLLMLAVGALAGGEEGWLMRGLRRNTARVKNAAGAVQLVVGLLLIASALFPGLFVDLLVP